MHIQYRFMRDSGKFVDTKELIVRCFALTSHYAKTIVDSCTFFLILFVSYTFSKLNRFKSSVYYLAFHNLQIICVA